MEYITRFDLGSEYVWYDATSGIPRYCSENAFRRKLDACNWACVGRKRSARGKYYTEYEYYCNGKLIGVQTDYYEYREVRIYG